FESDHQFDNFASPVSNPFLFEDPRSLTEIRPILIFQTIPGANPVFQGGNATFYGTQARLSLTDRWTVTINKLGGVSFSPDSASGLPSESGFAEFWIGPKWTFYRNCQTCSVAALGAIFQIPAGAGKVFQDTGDFSLTPYFSIAKSFCRTSYGA